MKTIELTTKDLFLLFLIFAGTENPISACVVVIAILFSIHNDEKEEGGQNDT